MMSANLRAFLALIRWCEGTSGENGYRTIVGGDLFTDFSDHPRIVKSGVFSNGKAWRSSAAGAYQFLSDTWNECCEELKLPDFSPASQDAAAVYLIKRRGALHAVENGDLDNAINLCNKEWASLPGSPYGQPVKSLDACKLIFERAGGTLMQRAGTTPQAAPPAPGSAAPSLKEEIMAIPALAVAAIVEVIKAIPSLARVIKPDSKTVERNSRAVEIIGETLQKVTGEASVPGAAAKVLENPAMLSAAEAALKDRYYDLVEVGGGVAAAREIDRVFMATGKNVFASPSFLVAVMLIPLVYMAMVSVSFKLSFLPEWPSDIRVAVISSIVGVVIGSITGYYYGMMTSANKVAQEK